MWARMVSVAAPKAAEPTSGFYAATVKVANFFYARVLPKAASLAAQVNAGAETLMDLEEELFYGE